MTSLVEFAAKWRGILNDPDLPQPVKSIAEFVKREEEKEGKK